MNVDIPNVNVGSDILNDVIDLVSDNGEQGSVAGGVAPLPGSDDHGGGGASGSGEDDADGARQSRGSSPCAASDVPEDMSEAGDSDVSSLGRAGVVPAKRGGAYRFQGRRIFLTFPRSTAFSESRLLYHLRRLSHASKWVYSREKHSDGELHWHVLVWFTRKVRRPGTFFNFDNFKCNIRTMKSKEDELQVIRYILKKGSYTYSEGDIAKHIFEKGWKNFQRERADFDSWLKFMRKVNRDDHVVFPVTLEGTDLVIDAPDPSVKKRHWLIIGPAEHGKTPWVQDHFPDNETFYVLDDDKNPYDTYDGEQYIVYDDVLPQSIREIKKVANQDKVDVAAPGHQRYNPKFMPAGRTRLVIIVCNPNSRPPYEYDEAFQLRFNTFEWPEDVYYQTE